MHYLCHHASSNLLEWKTDLFASKFLQIFYLYWMGDFLIEYLSLFFQTTSNNSLHTTDFMLTYMTSIQKSIAAKYTQYFKRFMLLHACVPVGTGLDDRLSSTNARPHGWIPRFEEYWGSPQNCSTASQKLGFPIAAYVWCSSQRRAQHKNINNINKNVSK